MPRLESEAGVALCIIDASIAIESEFKLEQDR